MTATDPTHVYQAQGDAAVSDALALNGQIKPVAYFPSATPDLDDRVTIAATDTWFPGRTGTVKWIAPDLADHQNPFGVQLDGDRMGLSYFSAADFAPAQTATQVREQTNTRVYASRVDFIAACHLPTAATTARSAAR